MQQSYAEKAARERLATLQEQMAENMQFQSALSNKVKNLRRKDFEQQIQPLYTQVEFKGGLLGGRLSKRRWVGGKLIGKITKGSTSSRLTESGTLSKKFFDPYAPKREQAAGLSGSMNVVSPSAQWTTEGHMETGPKIESSESKIESFGQIKNKRKNKMRKSFIDSNQFKVERLNYPGE